jgi:hypothetical protein
VSFSKTGNEKEIRFIKKYGRAFGPRRDEVTGDWRKLHN